MYLNSIRGLKKALESTDYYKSKRPTAKPIVIDRANFVINSIFEGNRHNWNIEDYQPVPLHRNILKSQLGSNEYIKVLNILKQLDYIKVDESYISQSLANSQNNIRAFNGLSPNIKAISKRYSFTAKSVSLGIIKVGVLSERTEKRLLKYKSNLLRHYLKNTQIHSKIFYNITDLHFNHKTAKGVMADNISKDSTEDKANHYFKTYKALQKINEYKTTQDYIESLEFYYTQSKLVNRVFHYYSNIPKGYRQHLQHKDGSRLCEIDLKNSQPLIIVMDYIKKVISTHNINIALKEGKRDIKGIDRLGSICVLESFCSESKELLDAVLNGTLYKTLAEYGLMQGNKEYYDMYINDYSKFKGAVLGEGLYFNLVPLNKIKDSERYLLELYPKFMQHIREEKRKNGYKSISINAQLIESSIFIDALFLRLKHGDDFAVPVHDSIIVKVAEVDYFKNILISIFEDKYPMLPTEIISNLFKIENYTNGK